ncbi:MAG: glycosyltransferase family 2 protein [Desulfobacterales bacterium]|nr:glycosyltransferase family 2 protein [Desulfobacterales bacterium]
MGVYNGARHIATQLNSILTQSHTNWELLVRDDVSSDDSMDILKSYADNDTRITLIRDNLGNKGALGNFSLLMEKGLQTSSRYFVFSDQDDIWQPDKLSVQLEQMKKTETNYGEIPILLHSDLEVVSASLDSISPSLMKYQGIRHESFDPLTVLLVQNFITGCTVMINRRLLEIALPLPKSALMHDWWLGLCAAVFGQIQFTNTPLVRYRQHDNNAVGAKSILQFLNPFKVNWWEAWLSGKKNLTQSIFQAQSLGRRILEHDPANQHLPLIQTYSSLLALTPTHRLLELKRRQIYPQAKFRQVLAMSRFLFLSEK